MMEEGNRIQQYLDKSHEQDFHGDKALQIMKLDQSGLEPNNLHSLKLGSWSFISNKA